MRPRVAGYENSAQQEMSPRVQPKPYHAQDRRVREEGHSQRQLSKSVCDALERGDLTGGNAHATCGAGGDTRGTGKSASVQAKSRHTGAEHDKPRRGGRSAWALALENRPESARMKKELSQMIKPPNPSTALIDQMLKCAGCVATSYPTRPAVPLMTANAAAGWIATRASSRSTILLTSSCT